MMISRNTDRIPLPINVYTVCWCNITILTFCSSQSNLSVVPHPSSIPCSHSWIRILNCPWWFLRVANSYCARPQPPNRGFLQTSRKRELGSIQLLHKVRFVKLKKVQKSSIIIHFYTQLLSPHRTDPDQTQHT